MEPKISYFPFPRVPFGNFLTFPGKGLLGLGTPKFSPHFFHILGVNFFNLFLPFFSKRVLPFNSSRGIPPGGFFLGWRFFFWGYAVLGFGGPSGDPIFFFCSPPKRSSRESNTYLRGKGSLCGTTNFPPYFKLGGTNLLKNF